MERTVKVQRPLPPGTNGPLLVTSEDGTYPTISMFIMDWEPAHAALLAMMGDKVKAYVVIEHMRTHDFDDITFKRLHEDQHPGW